MPRADGMTADEYRAHVDATMTEKQLQESVRRYAKAFGWLYFHPYDSRRSPSGYPDCTLVHPDTGEIYFVELKREDGRLTDNQRQWLEALNKVYPFRAFVIRPSTLDSLIEILRTGSRLP